MAFGVYVHIPYCLQRCVYCDFATYEFSQINSPEDYISSVECEITSRSKYIGPRKLDTVYFGGGTPSLLKPQLLGRVIKSLSSEGFIINSETEVTLEVNPATMNRDNILELMSLGFNRFSVGAQTLRNDLLKLAHRKHDAQDVRDTLEVLQTMKVNFSADILFALPHQSLKDLDEDLIGILEYSPQHISPYCLTVPESNPMARNRPEDDVQTEMFSLIRNKLTNAGLNAYEISNFSILGKESRHNLLYWNDKPYWGIGLSSHSYLPSWGEWGTRFWNPRGIGDYYKEINSGVLPWKQPQYHENLLYHQSLTDYFHTSLRKSEGLNPSLFKQKFHVELEAIAGLGIKKMVQVNWLTQHQVNGNYCLTQEGILMSNRVFEEFTFLAHTNTHLLG